MSEEADYIANELLWVIRCHMNRYIIRGKWLSYEALFCRLDDDHSTYRYLFYSMPLNQSFGPPDVVYYSPGMASDAKEHLSSSKVTLQALPW